MKKVCGGEKLTIISKLVEDFAEFLLVDSKHGKVLWALRTLLRLVLDHDAEDFALLRVHSLPHEIVGRSNCVWRLQKMIK